MQPSAHTRAGNATAAEPQSPTVGDLWRGVAESLRSTLSEGNYSIWFGRAHPLELSATTFLLAVPNPFTKEWIEDRFMGELRTAVREVSGRDIDVAIVAGDAFEDNIPETPAERPPEPVPDAGATRSLEPLVQFHPRYTFDSFVIGASNRFAHAAALAVAEAVAQSYNPLFIYGGAGLGKTHLLHAIGHYVRHCQPDLIVRYITTEQFMNEFVLSLQRRTIPEFHRRYRAVDLLMVDDIQFLEGKERTQEEFFHTFNTLHPRSQVVLTSDRAPKMISTLEERLRTRFEWGLITDIQPPDLETRLAILQRKAETDGLSAPTEALDYIAERIQTNIRELEGALIRVAAFASLTRTEITVDLAQDVLQSLLPNTEARVTSDLIIRVTAKYFDVTPHEVISPSRSRPLVNARQTAMYLCRELTDLSLPAIGGRFGGRDHTTVLHATKKISREMSHNPNVYEQVHELTARVRQQATGA